MNEPTNPSPPSEETRPIVSRIRLSPIQEAYGAYTRHQLQCNTCRDIDAGPCPAAGGLRNRWETLSGAAVRHVADGTP